MKKLTECYVSQPTREEAIEIVERIVANGGKCGDAVKGMGIESESKKYAHDDYECWGYSKPHGSYTNRRDSCWVQGTRPVTMHEFRELFPLGSDSPSEWNGEGLPPVGAVLKPEQVRLWGSNGWEALSDSVTAVSVDFIGASNVIITLSYPNKSREIHSLGGHIEFIPLRTKREKWIDKVIMYFYEDSEKTRTILGEIYDAGLAKDIKE